MTVGKDFDEGGVSHDLASCIGGKEEPTGPVCCRRERFGVRIGGRGIRTWDTKRELGVGFTLWWGSRAG